MSNTPISLQPEEMIIQQIEIMDEFIDSSADIINKYPNQPLPNSRMLADINSFTDPDLVEDVYSRASLCFENAADHFMAFIDTLKPPAKTLSPYTCVRSLLESCAIALWLLDLDVDITERVGRCFGYRYKEFVEQIKYIESDKVNDLEAQQKINNVKQRMAEVEKKALSLGYPELSKDGKRTGIATHMPSIVELVKITLDNESEYRLLSGIAHSYNWASRQVGFKVIEETDADGKRNIIAKKHVHPIMVLFGINLAVPTFTKVLWFTGKQYGWDMQEIERLLNHTFDKIGFKKDVRFWSQS